ncbi:hypothetical protein [Methylomicrobium sp. Wu6]|uniref:hypothetical protein n=1 Tax=Methylomicrobium sp. Wu6 TaxID=3107928 RepID=UPI002DD67C06|nr:hypothetical protein [Methylomicrobium sp. Wu6]MEC4750557.1 hypothetical protein [Methylomicrobium sp. Wu6]
MADPDAAINFNSIAPYEAQTTIKIPSRIKAFDMDTNRHSLNTGILKNVALYFRGRSAPPHFPVNGE